MVKIDCCTRTWPCPPQVSQVLGVEPLAAASIAGLGRRAFGRPRSLANPAFGEGGNLDLGLGAEDRLLEIQFEFVPQVRAAENLRVGTLTARKDVAEHLAEDVAECLSGAETAAAATLEARMAKLIVDGALFCVAKNFVRFLAILELMLGRRIVRIAVGVVFHGEASIGLLDIRFGCIAWHIQ